MFSRPGRGESEEELLRYQREFLARGGEPSASVRREENLAESSSSSSAPPSAAVGATGHDSLREKRPHDRDVVQLQGNESIDVFTKPPRPKKSKFKERHSPSIGQPNKNEKAVEEDDASELLDRHDKHVSVLLSQIKERDTRNIPVMMPSVTPKGFPTVVHCNTVEFSSVDKQAGQSSSKKSWFARQFARAEESDFGIMTNDAPASNSGSHDGDIDEDMVEEDMTFSMPALVTGEGLKGSNMAGNGTVVNEVQRIHEENVQKLLSMSKEEILEEQAKLKQMIDPSILKFLQEKRSQKISETSGQNDSANFEDDEGFDSKIFDDVISDERQEKPGQELSRQSDEAEKILGTNISEKWLHMDEVEQEKLEWMKACQPPSAKKSGTSEQARFDFEGNIVTGSEDIPEFLGLHHHGQEPERAGYSLEELFLLSRSNFLQQRVLAVNVLGRIIEKDRCGIFRGHLDQAVYPSLLEAGLPFLLRWSLDDSTDSLIAASVDCLAAMLCLQCDEVAADRLCSGWYRGSELPSLCVSSDEVKEHGDESSDLPDVDAVKKDLIKGLLQMRLVPRLRYILEVCRPSAPTVFNILDILIRIGRHSTEAAHSVARCPRLLETILIHFVPSSWKLRDQPSMVSDVYGHPLPRALKLFRVLCCAGKYLADTLVTKFGLITKILRFITVPADQMQLDVVEALELATESFRIWNTCISYGLACDVFSDVYAHIMSQMQSLSSLSLRDEPTISEHNTTCGTALVGLVEAITHVAGSKAELQAQMTTRLIKDQTLGGMEASHLPPSPVDWSHVTGLLPVIGHCVGLLKEQFVTVEDEDAKEDSFLLLASLFNLMASFYQKLVRQPSYSPVECLEEIEKFSVDAICVPIMASKTMKTMLAKMRLSTVITTCHKGVTDKFVSFVSNEDIINYLKSNSTPGRTDCESRCFFVKVEQHFQYFLIKLFYNILLHSGTLNGQLTALYHTASLLLFSRLFPGDEFYAHDLMSTVIFNSAFFYESKDESATTITSDMSEMGIDPPIEMDGDSQRKDKSFTRGQLLSEAHKDLLSIRSTFMSSFAQMRHALAKSRARSLHQPQNIASFLLPAADGTMLPVDWMFLPLVDIHNKAVKSELTSQPSDRPLNGSCSVVKRTLQWVLLLEDWRPVVLHKVPYTARIARLMCAFLTGSDLFLDNLVHHYLKTLFHSYTHSSSLANLDFNVSVPGITSFYDLFSSFLVQYEAVSFGDALFSCFLLLPLQQRYNEMLRKAVWSEHVALFRSFSLPIDQIPVPLEYYLVPRESNIEILSLQLRALATGALRQSWSPIFYLIAVHHICSFIFSKPVEQKMESQLFGQKLKLMNQVLLVPDESVRNDVICYWKPSCDCPKGFQVFTSLPPTRELLLRNKNQPEEAWRVWNQAS